MTVEVSAPFTHQYYLNKLLDFIEQHSKNSNEISIKEYNNAWADYWRYYIGVNVIPAVGISKVPIKGCYWTNYQNIPISEEQHNEWKNDNAFLDGMAVIAGRVYHRKDLSDYYFAGIDADNLPAIHELFTRNGKTVSVESMSQKTILDQHDNKERLHFYVYTVGTQLRDKKSDTGKPGFDSSQLPAFEVKASSKFLNFVAPCPHETSGIRQIVGTYTPITCGYPEPLEFQDHIDNICKKYGLDFGDGNGNGHAIYKIPIHDLFEDDFKVYKDHNRHEALMRVMESLMSRNVGILSEQEIQEISHKWNDKHCDPSLDAKEFERQWRCAKDFITKGNSNRNNGDKGEDSGRKKLSAKVIKTVEPQINLLFKDFTDTAFAAIGINGHKEITPVDKSKRFALWVRKVYYEQNNGATLSSDILKEVIETLKSKAIFDGQLKNLELRISKDPKDDLTYWYDLANENWEAVRITKDGWDIIPSDEVPIIFRRRSGQLAQVYPLKDYPVDILDQFLSLINVKDDENIKLILKCYIISLVIPGIAKVLLMVHSPKGAAKTAFQDLIKLLIDPSVFTSLTIPGSRRELVQQLQHNFLTFYDNLRLIPGWLSDDLCRAVTGTANSKRELYSDDDDIIYQYMRPIGFNGIHLVANKSDLLDRGLIVEVERIKNSDRRSFEYDIKPELERIKPHLLGFIFDTVVKVLIIQLKGGIKLKSVSRMADFEIACETISRCLGYEDGKFTAAYAENKNIGVSELIESSPVAKAIIELMKSNNKGSGTTTELLVVLEDVASILKISTQKDKSWPKAAHILGVRLKEIKTDLEEVGIYMHTTQNTKTKTKTLIFENRAPEEPEEPDKSDSRSNIDNVSGSPFGSFEVEAPAEAPADSPRTEHNFDSSGSPFLKERGNQGGTSDTSDINYKQQELEEETPLWVKENRGWSHIFDCNDCKLGGDTWYMQEHNCSGSMR